MLTNPSDALAIFAEQTDLVERLCDAVDREAENIGGESSLTVLRLLGPHHAKAKAALAAAPPAPSPTLDEAAMGNRKNMTAPDPKSSGALVSDIPSEAVQVSVSALDEAAIVERPWSPHKGGSCPLDPDVLLEVLTRSGSTTVMRAGAVIWRYGSTIWEIDGKPLPKEAEVVFYRAAAIRREGVTAVDHSADDGNMTDTPNIEPLRIDWNKFDLAEAYDLVEGVRRQAAQHPESGIDSALRAALDAIEAADCEWDGMTLPASRQQQPGTSHLNNEGTA